MIGLFFIGSLVSVIVLSILIYVENMIETVIALLMFVNGEIKEHLVQKTWLCAFEANVMRNVSIQNLYPTNAIRVRQK